MLYSVHNSDSTKNNNSERELRGDNKKYTTEKQKPNINNWNQAIKVCCTKKQFV